MCTAASYISKNCFFGRTLDYEFSYGEKIVIVPKNYPFNFTNTGINDNHYAIIGTAHVYSNYPLFYDAMNECGLGMAALNFVGNAYYTEPLVNKDNIAAYEFISYVLATCKDIDSVKELLLNVNITNTPFKNFPVSQLHWIIRDSNQCIVVEALHDGVHVYDNKIGVLTNNPPFNYQMENLNNYINLTNNDPLGDFVINDNARYSRGMGAIGLPGDLSSMSRFVRVAFTAFYSISFDDEVSSVNQFFHILESVNQTRGCCKVNNGYEITIYTSCMNLNLGYYYYKTYDNSSINYVSLNNVDLAKDNLYCYDMKKAVFNLQN